MVEGEEAEARPSGAVQAVVDWLVDGARTVRRPENVLAELCARLVACDVPLHRVAVFVRTLHPDVMGRRFLWRPGEAVQVNEAAHEVLDRDTFRRNPVAVVFGGGAPIRRRLADPDCPIDYPIVTELRAEGVTDYLIQPLPFTNGETHAVSWTTVRPGGFTDTDLAALSAVHLPLARVAEAYALRRVATTLLDTYVGHGSGARILQGRIRRGDVEHLPAVVLLSDLRGFTTLSNRLPGDRVIELLNRYFDCLVPPIQSRGGEVLKYLGDGLLAIFPVDDRPEAACEVAYAAAREALSALAVANAERSTRGEGTIDVERHRRGPDGGATEDAPRLRAGMALHLGEVAYGNIGSAGRLDFTAIGPAVNLTARLEALARDLGHELLVSAAFAAHGPAGLASLGSFELKGFDAPQQVFAPFAGRVAAR